MIIDDLYESPQLCPECGGISFSDLILAEKKDACYYKVKASAKVWPSAYASGRLVQCRKKGADSYGNKSEGKINEFAPPGGDDRGSDDEEILRRLAAQWWSGTEQQMAKAQQTLQALGWEIGPDESGDDDAGVYVYRIGDHDGRDTLAFAHSELSLDEGVAEAEDSKCPPATQDITLNLKNRQKAIDEYGYGPLNPDMPNRKFWQAKVEEWNLDSPEEAQQSLCGNCAAFDQREATLDCIAQGIGSNAGEQDATIQAGDLGYCRFLKFKCASRRTCDAWVTGGPLTDKQGVAEMDKSQTPPGRDGHVSYGTYGSRDKKDPDAGKKEYTAKMITPKKVAKHGEEILNKVFNKKPGVAEDQLDEKSTSQAQFRTMAAAAHNPEFAKKVGISRDVAKEFHGADRKQDYADLPKKADESKSAPKEKEADYGDDYQAMVARVKKLAGLGPLKTVYDPQKRVYRNIPTAQQPKK